VKRALLLIVLAGVALLTAATLPHGAVAALPNYSSGTSIGEGVPLKAYATLTPQVHLFGDTVTARLAVVADTKWVDPERLRVSAGFEPYTIVRTPQRTSYSVGRFQQVTWTWTLRCITTACVPRVPPSERFHIFRFRTIHIEYVALNGKRAYGIDATWPRVEVVSQVSPGVAKFLQKTNHLNWRFHIAPVASPTYRVSPTVLFWLAFGMGIALLLVAAAFGLALVPADPPAQGIRPRRGDGHTTLERAHRGARVGARARRRDARTQGARARGGRARRRDAGSRTSTSYPARHASSPGRRAHRRTTRSRRSPSARAATGRATEEVDE